MTLEDYADKLSELHSVLGDRYASILIGKLREGLTYNERQQRVRGGRVLQVVLDLSEAKMRCDIQDLVRLQGEASPAFSHPSFIPVAAIPKAKKTKTKGESKPMEVTKVVQYKEQPRTTAEIFAEVIETIRQEVAIEEAEIPAAVIQHIGEEVAIEEMIVVIEPEERAMEKRKQHPSAMAEIQADVQIEPIEEKVAIEEAEIPAEVIQPIEEKGIMEEVGVIQPFEDKVAVEELVVAIEPEEQAKAEGVTFVNPVEVGSGMIAIEGVIPDISEQSANAAIKEVVVVVELKEQAMAEILAEVVEPIEEVVVITEPDEQAMEGVNGVKYKDFQDELVPAEEHVTITEIQVKDMAHDINVTNTNICIREFMIDSTSFDPGGEEAWRFKQNYVREEERLRLKRNIAQITIINNDSGVKEEWFSYQEAFPAARRLQRRSWDDPPRRHCRAEWLRSLGIEIDQILQAKLSRHTESQLEDLMLRSRIVMWAGRYSYDQCTVFSSFFLLPTISSKKEG